MQADTARDGSIAILRLQGSVTAAEAPALRDALLEALHGGSDSVICDLSGVTALDPICLDVVAATQWSSPWPWPVVWLAGTPPDVASSLQAVADGAAVAVAETVQEALAAAARRPLVRSHALSTAPAPTAARRARSFVRELCEQWGVAVLADTCVQVASELVTNAVLHARTDLRLTVELGLGQICIAVRDQGPDFSPALWDYDDLGWTRESGRGLHLVRRLADTVGSTVHPDGGKVVWAAIRTGLPAAATAVDETVLVNVRRTQRRPGAGWSVRLRLRWQPQDPTTVLLSLECSPPHPALPHGQWRVSPRLLREGMRRPSADRHVSIRPDPEARAVLLELRSGKRLHAVRVPLPRLRQFLAAIQ